MDPSVIAIILVFAVAAGIFGLLWVLGDNDSDAKIDDGADSHADSFREGYYEKCMKKRCGGVNGSTSCARQYNC